MGNKNFKLIILFLLLVVFLLCGAGLKEKNMKLFYKNNEFHVNCFMDDNQIYLDANRLLDIFGYSKTKNLASSTIEFIKDQHTLSLEEHESTILFFDKNDDTSYKYLSNTPVLREETAYYIALEDFMDMLGVDYTLDSESEILNIVSGPDENINFKNGTYLGPNNEVYLATDIRKIVAWRLGKIAKPDDALDDDALSYLPCGTIYYDELQEFEVLSNEFDVIFKGKKITRIVNNIRALNGIQYFKNLKSIDLDIAAIKDKKLMRKLNLLKQLESVDIGGLYEPETMDLSVISLLTNIKKLGLHSTIDDASCLSSLDNLESLNLHVNNFVDLKSFSGLSHLKELDLSDNLLQTLDGIEVLTSLESINMAYNKIDNLATLGLLTNLRDIDLSNNKISHLEALSQLINLEKLNLVNNNICEIKALKELQMLKELSLEMNQISKVDGIENLKSLRVLGLADNNLTDASRLSNLINLEYLSLTENNLNNISFIQGFSKLKSISASYNNIENMNCLEDLSNLETVLFRNNKVKSLPEFSKLKKLIRLDIRGNLISDYSALKALSGVRIDSDEEVDQVK